MEHPAAEARWIGHSTVLISLDGVRLLTDPLLRLFAAHLRRRAPVHPDALRPVDAVLLSHAHHDHLDVGSLYRVGQRTPIVVPRGIGRILGRRGFREVTELDVGETLAIGQVEVEATFAAHDGARPPYPARAPALGYVVRGSRRVYFPGDTALFPEMDGLLPGLDLALIPIWGWGPTLGRGAHMDPEQGAAGARPAATEARRPDPLGTYAPAHLGLRKPPGYLADHR